MLRRPRVLATAFFCALVIVLPGSGSAQPPPVAAHPSANQHSVGADVIAAARSWMSGDASGRERLETLARAGKLYARGSALGFAKSMCALANFYVAGRGVPQDVARGAALCRQGADLGDADAQTDLGNLYLRGVGVPHDMIQARHWYELAAAQGQPNAEFVLGQIYWNGDGVAADQVKAAALLTAAYRGGRLDAAPLLASWTFAHWMAAHPKGDFSGLDQAIAWEQAAVKSAPDDKARDHDVDILKLMRATREAAVAEGR